MIEQVRSVVVCRWRGWVVQPTNSSKQPLRNLRLYPRAQSQGHRCYKWFWSCLPLWIAACLHSVSYTTLFFWQPHAGIPTIQTQDSWLSHLLLLWTPHLEFTPTRPDTVQPCHLLKPNWKPSSSHSISILTNISTQFLLQSMCVCVFVVRILFFIFSIILYVNCFGRTMLYMCIEYHI